jgi:hypothetical protein
MKEVSLICRPAPIAPRGVRLGAGLGAFASGERAGSGEMTKSHTDQKGLANENKSGTFAANADRIALRLEPVPEG